MLDAVTQRSCSKNVGAQLVSGDLSVGCVLNSTRMVSWNPASPPPTSYGLGLLVAGPGKRGCASEDPDC